MQACEVVLPRPVLVIPKRAMASKRPAVQEGKMCLKRPAAQDAEQGCTMVTKGDMKRRRRNVMLGSDCTGLNGGRLAMDSLGPSIKVTEKFASDANPTVRRFLMHNFTELNEGNIYTDCVDRDHNSVPYVDVYLAGFPCQDWSQLGPRAGLKGERGSVALGVLSYIYAKKPRVFLLENVEALAHKSHKADLNRILHVLTSVKTKGNQTYRVVWWTMNTLQHGLPQSRPRSIQRISHVR